MVPPDSGQLREEVVADLIPSAVIAGDRTVPGQVNRTGFHAVFFLAASSDGEPVS